MVSPDLAEVHMGMNLSVVKFPLLKKINKVTFIFFFNCLKMPRAVNGLSSHRNKVRNKVVFCPKQ